MLPITTTPPVTTVNSPITPVAGTTNTPVANTTGIDPNALLSSIVQQQAGQAGISSSTPSTIQTNLASAVAAAQNQGKARDASITSDYGNQIDNASSEAQYNMSNGRAAGGGGLLNLAALNELTGRTESQLKQLNDAKQQALLNNDTQTATAITTLQTQAYQFQQQANQQVFSNILGIGQFQNSQQQLANSTKQITDQEQKAINDTALQYGLTVQPGDTLATITSRAAPLASKAQQLDLQTKLANINELNGRAQYYREQGAKAANAPALTEAQTRAQGFNTVASILTPGATFNEQQPDGSIIQGKSVVDPNGFVVPTAWKQLVQQAPGLGLTTNDILDNYSGKLAPAYDKKGRAIPGSVNPAYGLSAKQLSDYKLTDGTS